MKTEEQVREEMRNTEAGRLLVRYGFEPYDTESCAHRVAEKAAAEIKTILDALQKASDHLDYCGYGDSWEREGTGPLQKQIADAIALANARDVPTPTSTNNPQGTPLTPSGLSVRAGSAFPTYAEMYKALDELHIVCECATMPEVETWYRGDIFAKEARQRAIDVLCRHTYAEREREMLIGFREAVRRIAEKPIDSSDMMDEIEYLLSLPQNGRDEPRGQNTTKLTP